MGSASGTLGCTYSIILHRAVLLHVFKVGDGGGMSAGLECAGRGLATATQDSTTSSATDVSGWVNMF